MTLGLGSLALQVAEQRLVGSPLTWQRALRGVPQVCKQALWWGRLPLQRSDRLTGSVFLRWCV